MRAVFSATALAAAAIMTALVWSNWSYVDAYMNNVGAPDISQTSDVFVPIEPALLRLAVAGDVGTGGSAEYETVSVMDSLEEQQPYDALLLLGDNVYENGDPADVQNKTLDPFAPVLDGGTELLAVLGNHDVRDGNGPGQAEALGMPAEWYANRIGNTTIIALDSNQADVPEQKLWLRSQLAVLTTDWTVVIMHHPAFSAGWHGGDASVVENFVPLFEEFGVDLVLSGHDHDYQRSNSINGVTYVVTGAAAKLRAAGREDFTAASWSTHSFVDILIYPDRLQLQAVDHDGRQIDSFVLNRPVSCVAGDPEVVDFNLTIDSEIYGTVERVNVHLTPCAGTGSQPLPVLYLLHGAGADETQWPDVDILTAIDNAVSTGSFPPAVIIIPDAASAYRDIEGTADLTAHLLGEVEPMVSEIAPIDVRRRAIGGISRGGGLALRVAGQSPTEFVAVGAHSSVSAPDETLASIARSGLSVYLDSGTGDSLSVEAERMADVLTNLGASVELTISPGAHDREYWRSQATSYARFYGDALDHQ